MSKGAIKESLTASACVSSPIIKNVSVVVLENVHTLWCTVGSNLGDKEWFDKEQIGVNVNEPFPVTNLPIYFIRKRNIWH